MKVFFLMILLSVSASAFSQTSNLNMIEMSTTSNTLGALTFSDDGDTTDKSAYVGANYAFRFSERVQLGIQGNYSRFDSTNTSETYNFLLGAIYNFNDDLTNAIYASLYGGMGWNYYSSSSSRNVHTETLTGRAAIGKRFALSNINLPNVTYSPEISYTRNENTKSSYGYNSVAIRFLQFSMFF